MKILLVLSLLMLTTVRLMAQEDSSLTDKILRLPDKIFGCIRTKSNKLDMQISKSIDKYLTKLERQELKMQRKMRTKDSANTAKIFGDVKEHYQQLRNEASHVENIDRQYSPHLDSLHTGLTFLKSSGVLSQTAGVQHNVTASIGSLNEAQNALNQATYIRQKIEERRAYLKRTLSNSIIAANFRKYQESIYYYRSKIMEYTHAWENPKAIENAFLSGLTKVPAFHAFFHQYSQLGSVFMLSAPESFSGIAPGGMQTRAQIVGQLNQQFGSFTAAQHNLNGSLGTAQNALQQVKQKLSSLGQGTADPEIPDFKPNTQRTKSFLQRIELGANIQSSKSKFYIPTTTDIGLSAGYRFSQNQTAGIGFSTKIGWGDDIRHISMSYQGISLRSFVESKMKGSFWISGGIEKNYLPTITHLAELKGVANWQTSALLGVSKKYKIGRKSGDLKLLYDFLWRQSVPNTQPILFRTGYTF